MSNASPAGYQQVLRIDPNTKPSVLRKFKIAMNGEGRFSQGKEFDLRGIAVPPDELVNRTFKEVKSTSSAARKESRRLVKKYRVDNVKDWRREHWHGVSENVTFAMWIDDYTLNFNSPEKLHHLLQYLSKKHNLEMYYSHVDTCDSYFEEDCGIAKIGRLSEIYELGNDRFELFAFGTVLLNGYPTSFSEWENEHILHSVDKYYKEHFIEENAKNRMKEAFSDGKRIRLANTMVNETLTPERVWETLSKLL